MTYPTISHLIESFTGIFIPLPIQTFGFFIVMAFMFGHYFIKNECLRLEKLNIFKSVDISSKKTNYTIFVEYGVNILMSFFFGYKIIYIITNYKFFSESPQTVLLSSEGSLLLGVLFSLITVLYIYYSNEKTTSPKVNKVLPSELSWNFIFIAAISGIIGAKLFAVFEDVDYLLENPLSALFSFSGLTFYGGLIMGTTCVIIYAKKHQINIFKLADVFAPSLILSYGIGRLGCHFSGDGDWGIISDMNNKPFLIPDWLWGYSFPRNVIEEGVRIPECVGKYCYELPYLVYPTSLYEALFGITAFMLLWWMRKHISKAGGLFCIYLILNGIERFLIETIRVTDKYDIIGFNLTQAQLIGFMISILGLSGIIYLYNHKKNTYS